MRSSRRAGLGRGAFSMIEVVLVMSITALIVSIVIPYFSESQEDGLRAATFQDLDALRRAIELRQTETHVPYGATAAPVLPSLASAAADGAARDRWGNPYRVDPASRKVYSLGPDGLDGHGTGDDLALEYASAVGDVRPEPPRDLRAAPGGPPVALAWRPPLSRVPVGYRLERRTADQPSWSPFGPEEPLPATGAPTFEDPAPPPGVVYYRVRAVFPGDPYPGPPSEQAGWFPFKASPPTLSVDPASWSGLAGSPIVFLVRAAAYGTTLRRLTFDGEDIPVEGATAELRLSRTYDASKDFTVALQDALGATTEVPVTVAVP